MSLSLKPYSVYQETGVSWLGAVPQHWRLNPGLAALGEKQIKNLGLLETKVLSLSYGSIVVKPEDKLHGLVPVSFETYQIVEPGDIIVRPTDLQNDWNSIRVGIARDRGIITSAYMCLRSRGAVSPEYAYLLLLAYDLSKVFYGMGSGLRQNLDFKDFKRMPFLIPPEQDQAQIAAFIRAFDHRIRRLITAKLRLMDQLSEQKRAIVQTAVTRGLNPDVTFKRTEAEWLGDIPTHWEVKRGKYYYHEVDERSTMGQEELLSVSHLTGVTPRSEKNVSMFLAESYIGSKVCRPGDLVVNTMWAWMAALGVSERVGIVSPSYAVYRPHRRSPLLPKFADHLLRTRPYAAEYERRSTGIRRSRLRLYPEKFLAIPLICPPVDEQQTILAYIDTETAAINTALSNSRKQIDLLREYRNRMLCDVVTGKLDVRDVKIDEVDDLEGHTTWGETLGEDSTIDTCDASVHHDQI